jgi:outer membrane protein assembly factor BamB
MRIAIILTAALALPGQIRADWLQFRGPNGLGFSGEEHLPVHWSAQTNIIWKTALPGPGSSSPIIVGDRIFVTCYSGYGLDQNNPGDIEQLQRRLVCLDRTGKILWQRAVNAEQPETPFRGFVALHGFASSTPVSDGKNVFVFFGKSGVLAFDLQGKELWRSSVGHETHGWGSGSSPVVAGDLVIVNAGAESGRIVALRMSDGAEVWAVDGAGYSWSTPLLVGVAGGKQELVLNLARKVRGYDPKTGKLLWTCNGVEDYVCPTATAHDGVVYVIGGRSGTAIAIRAGGRGDVSDSHILWKTKRGSNVSSPVYHAGHLYWAHEGRGIVYCLKADTGKVIYEQKLTPFSDRVYASVLCADGKLYYVSRTNGTYVVAASPEFKLLAHNSLAPDDSICNGSPAVSDSKLFLRSNRHLYCIGIKQ